MWTNIFRQVNNMAERQVYFTTPTEHSADRCIESAPIIVNSTGVEY